MTDMKSLDVTAYHIQKKKKLQDKAHRENWSQSLMWPALEPDNWPQMVVISGNSMRFDSLAASFPATHYQRVHQTKVEYEFQSIVSSYQSQWGILFRLESFRNNFEL